MTRFPQRLATKTAVFPGPLFLAPGSSNEDCILCDSTNDIVWGTPAMEGIF